MEFVQVTFDRIISKPEVRLRAKKKLQTSLSRRFDGLADFFSFSFANFELFCEESFSSFLFKLDDVSVLIFLHDFASWWPLCI